MKPIRWDRPGCDVCGAEPFRECDYESTAVWSDRKTHIERQWRAIDMWWLDQLAEWMSVACPVTYCAAGVGRRCKGTEKEYMNPYYTHLPRRRLAAKAIEERESNERSNTSADHVGFVRW